MLGKGAVLADYRVEGVIGRGGMGCIVYEATQLSLQRRVALKVLATHLSKDPEFRRRFRHEGHAQAALDHDHIVTVYEAGETELGLFLSMQLVHGCNLKDLIAAELLDPPRTVRLLVPVADALDTAHAFGVIHRDIKPQNILVDGADHPYLADFGLVKERSAASVTDSGPFIGTCDYVSPEQIVGGDAAPQGDLYSFAAVVYECLAGVTPFPADTDAAVLHAHVHEPPPRISEARAGLPAALDEVLARGLAKEPRQRHASATGLMSEVERALDLAGARLASAESRAGSAPLPPHAPAAATRSRASTTPLSVEGLRSAPRRRPGSSSAS